MALPTGRRLMLGIINLLSNPSAVDYNDYMKHSSGQIVLVTLLILTVVTSIALALVGRSRRDVTTTADVEESMRAFNAAEAGIEQALKGATGASGVQLSGVPVSYTTDIQQVTANSSGDYDFPQATANGDTDTLWLVDHGPDQALIETAVYKNDTIDVCWEHSGASALEPGLIVGVLFKRGTTYLLAKATFAPNSGGVPANNFTLVSSTTGCGKSNVYKATITFSDLKDASGRIINVNSDILLALRLRPVYADASLYIHGYSTVASQASIITSSGVTGSGTTRKVVVTQQFRSPPSIFDMAVLSQVNLYR